MSYYIVYILYIIYIILYHKVSVMHCKNNACTIFDYQSVIVEILATCSLPKAWKQQRAAQRASSQLDISRLGESFAASRR